MESGCPRVAPYIWLGFIRNGVAGTLILSAFCAAALRGEDDRDKIHMLREVKDIEGGIHRADQPENRRGLVLVFVTTDCPIANSYQPRIRAIQNEFRADGFAFLLVHEGEGSTAASVCRHARDYEVSIPLVLDEGHRLAKAVGATATPEVAIVDPTGQVRYRGRIDDQYPGYGKKRPAPTREDLRQALRELREGKEPTVPRTKPVGCLIHHAPD